MHKAAHAVRLGMTVAVAGFLCAVAAVAQEPAFAVATIRPAQQSVAYESDGRTEFTRDTLRMHDVTLATCVKLAWHVQGSQIVGVSLPAGARYDITAKMDAPATEDQMKLALRALLAERFGLAMHRDRREMRVLTMTTAASGAKLKPTADPTAAPFRENSANGTVARAMPLAEFADFLSGPLQMPILDQTGMTGRYDFALDFTPYLPEAGKNMDGTRPDTTAIVKAAMHDELGLDLKVRRAGMDVLVVDRVERPSPD